MVEKRYEIQELEVKWFSDPLNHVEYANTVVGVLAWPEGFPHE
jgi:hypothetical protein